MKEQINELTSMKWKDKKIKLFVFGDYWFCLCPQDHIHVYGAMSTNMKCRAIIARFLNLEFFSCFEMIF